MIKYTFYYTLQNHFLNSADIPAVKSRSAPTIPWVVPINTRIAAIINGLCKKKMQSPKKTPQ